jgi:hypothetical protein
MIYLLPELVNSLNYVMNENISSGKVLSRVCQNKG